MAFMRKSKFRHVFGKPLKKDDGYDNIRITKNSWDSPFCSVNPKYIAIITESAGGGSFLILPIKQTGRVEMGHPVVDGHKGPVLDIAFCPHNDDVIASCSEDCTVKVWQIPEGGLTRNLTEPVVELVSHIKRVGIVTWHPSAQNILLSAGADCKICIWNVGTGELYVEINLPDIIYSANFSYNGDRFVCTCKDKHLRVIDSRTGKVVKETKEPCHQGSKPAQALYLKNDKVFTTGFSRMSDRQYALWNANTLEQISLDEIDQANGVLMPVYDGDVEMIYLIGKGDSIIRYYEITNEAPYVHYLSLYQGKDPTRGFGVMCKRGLNINNCEISRIYKLLNTGQVEVIPFTVPRKSELFQDDIYPETASDVPAISGEDWFNGSSADPVLISLKDMFASEMKEPAKVVVKSNILDKKVPATPSRRSADVASSHHKVASTPVVRPASEAAPAAAEPAAELPPEKGTAPTSKPSIGPKPGSNPEPEGFDPQGILEDIRKLKLIVKAHERRIKTLEERVAHYENPSTDEEGTGETC
ncbi:coronin-1B-like isoform X2 [Ostrea edulis]|uniref:coronin-1B-like isoform X2 n=1 Tax=Ostrea edulis TaxID=37623 RepID=UPI002094963A|nr:coronin-1B-like isoform X2 [Ostrea edulis]